MASLRKFPRSPYWFACFTAPDGRRLQRSTKETTQKKAQTKADQWEKVSKDRASARQAHRVIAEIYQLAHKETLPMSTARAFFAGYLARRAPEVSRATFVAYEGRSKHFLNWLGEKADLPLSEIYPEDILRYRDSEVARVSRTTVNIAVKILRVMFEDARRENLIADNPAKDVQTLRNAGQGSARRPFTEDELRAVLKVANDEWRSLIIFGIYTGGRLGDLAALTWANLDTMSGEVRFRTGKTGRLSAVPFHDALRKHIANLPGNDNPRAPLHPRSFALLQGNRGRASTLSRQFSELLADAGLVAVRKHQKTGNGRSARRESSELSFHALRHTTTSYLKNAGISPAIVQDIIGHESAEVSAHYTHIDADSKLKAIKALPDFTH